MSRPRLVSSSDRKIRKIMTRNSVAETSRWVHRVNSLVKFIACEFGQCFHFDVQLHGERRASSLIHRALKDQYTDIEPGPNLRFFFFFHYKTENRIIVRESLTVKKIASLASIDGASATSNLIVFDSQRAKSNKKRNKNQKQKTLIYLALALILPIGPLSSEDRATYVCTSAPHFCVVISN